MPFDVLNSSDDDQNADLLAEEANWPEELSLLAGQLSADAARLAALYPAASGSTETTRAGAAPATIEGAASEPSTGWLAALRGARWIAAAAILAVASTAVFSAYPRLEPGANVEPDVALTVQIAAHAESGGSTAPDAALQFEETGFENLSSPAQEALLDLFEDDQLAQTSLSI